MLRNAAKLFGIVFVILGLGGFLPFLAPENSEGVPVLLGILAVGVLHNIIHLASGVVALISSKSEAYAKTYFQVFGVVYALVTVIGFVQGDSILGLMTVNLADNLLHVAIAVSSLALGFGSYGKTQPKAV